MSDKNALFIEIENVARWLENGCDTAHAARELRLIAANVRPAVEPPAPPVQVPDVSADLSRYGFAFVLVRPGGATYRVDPLDVTLQKFPDQPENR